MVSQAIAKDKPDTNEANRPTVHEAPDDPHRLARLYLQDNSTEDGPALRFHAEEWHRWDGRAYVKVPDKELKAALCGRIKREFDRLALAAHRAWKKENEENGIDGKKAGKPPLTRKVTQSLTGNTVQALASLTVLPSSITAPAWIGEEPAPFQAEEVLACRNGLAHLPSFVDGLPFDEYRHPHTSRFFSPNALSYDFDPEAPPPAEWLAFLHRIWPNDQEAIMALQEWFGYCLLPDTSQQKILLIVGPKRSGKGTIAHVLRSLVGIDNTAGPTLAGLGTNFGLQPLLGKTLATISDARLSGRTDSAIVTERLLSISGEDAITIDRKMLSAITTRLPVRFVILTNELPRFSDSSGALASRFLVLRQTESWYGKEDHGLKDRLTEELPSILGWALTGWERLRERGHFCQPASAANIAAEMEEVASPVQAFLNECCLVGPGHEVERGQLYNRWRQWCDETGKKEPGQVHTFGRDLRACLPYIESSQPWRDGSRVRVYRGVGINPAWFPANSEWSD